MNPNRWISRALVAVTLCVASPSFSQEGAAPASEGPEAEAEAYLATWEKRGKEPCANNDPGCAAAGHALFKAAAAFDAAHKADKAIAARRMILDPKNHLDYTDYGKTTAFDLALNYQYIAEYSEAASLYESAARKFPAMDRAPEALMDAITLRLGLGDVEKAVEDADLFGKNFGAKRAADHAKVLVAIGAFHVEKENYAEAKKWLERSMAPVDRAGTLDVRVLAHASLGRTLAKLGDKKKAEKEFEIVRASWKDPAAAIKALDAIGGTEEDRMKRIGRTLTLVGEAIFFFAEQKRLAADAIRYPEYNGSTDMDAVKKHINSKVRDWVGTKRAAIQEADKAYLEVLALQPMPPPRWVIASAARSGSLWGKFVAEFRAAPIPKEWKGNGKVPGTEVTYASIRSSYYKSLDEASEPQKQQAKAAFKMCVDSSKKYQWFDEYSRHCNTWLAKSYPKEHIAVEEFIPKLAGAGFVIWPAPVAKSEKSR